MIERLESPLIGIYKRMGAPSPSAYEPRCLHIPLELDKIMAELRGKLFINWGKERVWAQFAKTKKKEKTQKVIEIRRTENDPFPSWRNFSSTLTALETLPDAWRDVLTNLTGIYLLSRPDNKEPCYVGQADGHGGFLGRWEDYARTGHGGNVAMKGSPKIDYVVRILELGTDDELGQKERRWKEILGTKVGELGLNRN